MKKYNCVVVFDAEKQNILFCKRIKDPYKGLYNFPGGKIEPDEGSLDAAYRELLEETGISKADINLKHFMDITYYMRDFVLELYVGQLKGKVEIIEEVNPLEWLPVTNDFADKSMYAGDQNIAHIVNVAMMCEPD